MYYLIVAIAAAVASIGISLNYVAHLGTITRISREGEEKTGMTVQAAITRFLFSTMLIELVPIAIIIISYVALDHNAAGIPATPLIIIILAFLFGVIQVAIRMNRDLPADIKKQVRSLSFIAIQLIATVPIVAVIFMII